MAAALVRLPWLFIVPTSEAPDEETHFWVLNFMREHHALPSASDVAAGGITAVYGSLPPLGYLPHLLMCSLVPDDQALFYARYGSLFMGLLTVYAAYRIGAEIFPKNKLLRRALPAMLVFHPQLVFVNSYVNNDATTCGIASIVLWLLVRTLKYGLNLRRTLGIGALLGWLTLSKYSGLTLLPVVGLAFIAAGASAAMPSASYIRVALSLVIIGGMMALLSGWWFVRNWHEFHGDLLGTRTMYLTWATAYHKNLDYYKSPISVLFDHRWWRMFYFSFWGVFGYMNRYLVKPIYWIYQGFLVASSIGWLTQMSRNWINAVDRKERLIWGMFALTCAINLSAMIWASTGNLGGPQGRYFFPSEIPFMSILLAGLYALGPRSGPKLVIALLGYNVGVCFYSMVKLLLMYR
jgi:4-amino-4-deoxy-L-arabinose transferase-like glycosyltransferase